MKIQELRINNLLLRRGFFENVVTISKNKVNGSNITEFKPIELTPEILEKCGFIKQENGWYKFNILEDYINLYFERLTKTELSISGLGIKMPHIQYLHQLQNLYFALTGEELEINL
jgi:hypothetical protein